MDGLLERDEAFAMLNARVADAAAGRGSVVLVSGEAGVGKTALAREFCRQHDGGAQVLWGACDALSTPRPLGPLHDMPPLAGLIANEASRSTLFSKFLTVISSAMRPAIVVIEDMHWADEATRDLLVFVARRVADTHATVVVTFRDDDMDLDHPLRLVLGNLATLPTVYRLTLLRLSEEAVAALAADRDIDSAHLYQVTAGNPFFVSELLDVPEGAVPVTVRDAVLARAARLSRTARAVLEAAAVAPDRADIGLIAAMVGDAVDAIDECEQAGMLHVSGRVIRFRHELARLAVEQAIPRSRVPMLHARVLSYLADQPGAELARLVYHADQAGDVQAVARYAPEAAAQAAALGAHRLAADHYQLVLRDAGALSPAERAELLEQYADQCAAIDQDEMAVAALDEARAIWQRLGEVDRAGRALARRASCLWGLARNDEAHASAREAVTLLRQRPPSAALAYAYLSAANLRMLANEITEAIEVGQQAIELAEQFGDKAMLAKALNVVGSSQLFLDPAAAEATLTRGVEVAHAAGDDASVGALMTNLGSGAGEVRRYTTADRWLQEAARWSAEHDLDWYLYYCQAWLARNHFEQGRWPEAEAVIRGLNLATIHSGPTRIVALTVQGRMRVRRGDRDAIGPLSEAWELAGRTGDVQRLWPVAAGLAEDAWLSRHPERIPALVGETFELAAEVVHPWALGELAFWMWRVGALAAAPAGAAEPYAAQIGGDWSTAADAWAALGCPYEAATARADSARSEDLLAALDELNRLGARPAAGIVMASLRDAGVHRLPRRPHRGTVENPGGLTDRELDVLRRLMDGATNAEIAAGLHISTKTAANHVSAILSKLDVTSRREAARVARSLGIGAER